VRPIFKTANALFMALLSVSASPQTNWVRQGPFPTDRSSRAVFAISADRAYFVGENKLMLQTQNAGSSWTVHQLLDWGVDPLYAVHFTSPTIGVALGNNEAMRTTDGGATWTPVSMFAGSWSYLDFIDQSVGFAGANGACAMTTDGGQSWQLRSGYPDCPVMFGMDFRDASVGLAGGIMVSTSEEGIFKTSNGGQTWTKKASGAANDVVWTSPTRAISDYGMTVRESLDSGESWHTVFSGLTTGMVSMCRAGNGSVVLGVSAAGDVWRSADGGLFWQQTFDGPGALPDIWEISFADSMHGWIVGPGGFYYYSDDGGLTWIQKNNGCTAQITDIQMLDSNYGLAVGHNGYIFRTTNGGGFWDIQKLEVTGQIWGRDEDLVALDIVDADFAIAAGPGGTVFKTLDGGLSWTSIGYPLLSGDYWIYDVDFIDHNLGYVYGVNAPDDTRFLFRTRNGGLTWEWVDMGYIGGGTTAQFVDADYGWLTSDNNFGWRTTNGGVSWTSFNMPTYFSGPEVSRVRFLDRNIGWVVGWDGYVGKTSNGGVTWTPIDMGTVEDHFFDVVPVSASEIWICGRESWSFKGLIYHSTNGGQTWTRQVVTDWFYYPYRISVLPSGDVWFAGYAGAIFKKTSGTVLGSSMTVVRGVVESGNLASTHSTDADRLVVAAWATTSPLEHPVDVRITGAVGAVTSMKLHWRGSCSFTGFTLYRWVKRVSDGVFVLVGSGPAPTTETTIEDVVPNPSLYIDGAGNVTWRVSIYQTGMSPGWPPRLRTDEFTVRVTR
jgi:photosystem II stability/assembly factor-like uncharacterized protein